MMLLDLLSLECHQNGYSQCLFLSIYHVLVSQKKFVTQFYTEANGPVEVNSSHGAASDQYQMFL